MSGGGAGSVLDGVPFGQPALSLAAQLQHRAGRAGAPAELADLARLAAGLARPIRRTWPPIRQTALANLAGPGLARAPDPAAEQPVSDVGAALFALVTRACEAGLDPELELRAAARAYRHRVRAWEQAQEQVPES